MTQKESGTLPPLQDSSEGKEPKDKGGYEELANLAKQLQGPDHKDKK